MDRLEEIIGKGLESADVNTNLVEQFKSAVFSDIFLLDLLYYLDAYLCQAGAQVTITRENPNFNAFLEKHSLRGKIEQLLGTAQSARDHMQDNFSELVFSFAYLDTSPSNRKKVEYFHEFNNRGQNMRRLWADRITYYSGGAAALVTVALGYSQFVASQPLINIGQQTFGWILLPMWIPPIGAKIMGKFKTPHKVWRREREYLGRERIVEDEATLESKYNWLPGNKIYSGQFDRYKLSSPHGKIINLRSWEKHKKENELFKVIFSDRPADGLILIARLEGKIGGKSLYIEQKEAFEYNARKGLSDLIPRYIDTDCVEKIQIPGHISI